VTNDELTNDENTESEYSPPWEQQENESAKHFAWFYEFLLLGPGRTLMGAFNLFHERKSVKSGKNWQKKADATPAWKAISKQHSWHERAQAYDKEQRRLEQEKIAARREALVKRRFDLAEKILEKAEVMASFPVATTKQVGNSTIIEPAKWSFDTIVKMVQASDRLLADEDETTVKVTRRKGAAANDDLVNDDDDDLTDEEIEERIAVIINRGRTRGNKASSANQGTSGAAETPE
jgi:hypothetical protein